MHKVLLRGGTLTLTLSQRERGVGGRSQGGGEDQGEEADTAALGFR